MATITGPMARVAAQILDNVNTLEDWRIINEYMGQKLKIIQKATLRQFKIGDCVEWDSKLGNVQKGIIVKINSKTIIVIVEHGYRTVEWKVSPSLLRKTALKVA